LELDRIFWSEPKGGSPLIGIHKHMEARKMNADLAQELLNELGSSLENLETQQAALLQFLKDEGVVTEERLAAYLTHAGTSSEVRWRAARVRLARLISAQAEREEQQNKERLEQKEKQKTGAAEAHSQDQGKEAAGKNDEGGGEVAPDRAAAAAKDGPEKAGDQAASEKDGKQDERQNV
jgi:hypothetical protein